MSAFKVKSLWTAFVTAFFAVLASLGLMSTTAAAAQPAATVQVYTGATAATATTPSVRWTLPRDRALPPTMKQRIRAEAHGSSPANRHLSAHAAAATGLDGDVATDLAAGAAAVQHVVVSTEIAGYIVDIARATRSSPSLALGVSPRGATALLATSRAWAWLNGRTFVTPDDVKAMAHATLAHRLTLRPEAELEGVSVAAVLDSALGSVAVPR